MGRLKKENQKANVLLKTNADEDELLINLQTLILKREKILEQVNKVKSDCDKLTELLLCSTKEDVELVIEEAFPVEDYEEEKFHLSTEEIKLLVNRHSLIENFNLQTILGFGIRTTDDNRIFAHLSPIPNCEDTEMCLIDFKRKRNSKLMLNHMVIPDLRDIESFKNDYINQKSQDVPSFMNLIQQYLFYFWAKGTIVDALKKEKRVDESKIYCNKTRELISFIFKYKDKCKVEFKLMYDLTTLCPNVVQYRIIDNEHFSEIEVTRSLDILKKLLLENSVVKAFSDYEVDRETSDSTGSSESGDRFRLDFF